MARAAGRMVLMASYPGSVELKPAFDGAPDTAAGDADLPDDAAGARRRQAASSGCAGQCGQRVRHPAVRTPALARDCPGSP